jgi:hypothetical protein
MSTVAGCASTPARAVPPSPWTPARAGGRSTGAPCSRKRHGSPVSPRLRLRARRHGPARSVAGAIRLLGCATRRRRRERSAPGRRTAGSAGPSCWSVTPTAAPGCSPLPARPRRLSPSRLVRTGTAAPGRAWRGRDGRAGARGGATRRAGDPRPPQRRAGSRGAALGRGSPWPSAVALAGDADRPRGSAGGRGAGAADFGDGGAALWRPPQRRWRRRYARRRERYPPPPGDPAPNERRGSGADLDRAAADSRGIDGGAPRRAGGRRTRRRGSGGPGVVVGRAPAGPQWVPRRVLPLPRPGGAAAALARRLRVWRPDGGGTRRPAGVGQAAGPFGARTRVVERGRRHRRPRPWGVGRAPAGAGIGVRPPARVSGAVQPARPG